MNYDVYEFFTNEEKRNLFDVDFRGENIRFYVFWGATPLMLDQYDSYFEYHGYRYYVSNEWQKEDNIAYRAVGKIIQIGFANEI